MFIEPSLDSLNFLNVSLQVWIPRLYSIVVLLEKTYKSFHYYYYYYLRTFLRGRGLGWGGVKTCIFATIDDHFDRSFANFSRFVAFDSP